MSKDIYLSDDSKIWLIDALAGEIIEAGQKEAEIIASGVLTEDESAILMKSNTFLTTFAMLLLKAVERRDTKLAKSVLDVWTSNEIQDLVQYAFTDEILSANQSIADSIDELERMLNEQGKEQE